MKEKYIKEPTRTTPHTSVNFETGRVILYGRSSPENTMEFYDPFIQSIQSLGETQLRAIRADFKMIYFNTSSARCIYLIVKELKELEERGKKVKINWHAEEDDEDMVETALDFQDILDIPFNVVRFKAG